MATAKIFKSGNSQAVRLPKQFRFKSAEVEITRRGDEVVLRELPKRRRGLEEVFDILVSMPEDMFKEIKETRPPERRKGL